MREIKFRGRDEHGEWHYGAFMGVSYDGVVAPIEYANIYDDGIANRVFPDTVGQFTGLLDSAGKEIYEGDIISLQGAYGSNATLVKWHDGMWCIKKDLPLCYCTAIASVIGNVYDSPGLLRRES